MACILVCGGAGYIGSHMVRTILAAGHTPVVFDSFVKGHIEAVPYGVASIKGDLLDMQTLRRAFSEYCIDAVLHFAARIEVGESVIDPELYYSNNVAGSLNLLAVMREFGVNKLVFSSTAAVYGNPVQEKIKEDHPLQPINPYGRSKLMIEQIIEDFSKAYNLNAVCLRYFNASGADSSGEIGEAHDPESHLIPNILKAAVNLDKPLQEGEKPFELRIFGSDYDTPDGTCVRDYVHVSDLCSAHLLALDYLQSFKGKIAFNLGSGSGYSILQVLAAAERVSGKKIPYTMSPRRVGDAARLVADSTLARSVLNWQPQFENLDAIVETAWNWEINKKY